MDATPTNPLAGWRQFLEGCAKGWNLRPLDGAGRCALATKLAVVDTPLIDRGKMAAPCTITTQDEDRQGDVVRTRGLDLAGHRANPVVLYNHGAEGGLPVGKAQDDAGAYSVTPEDGRVRSVTYFTNKHLFSEQVFQLVEEGVLRGVSIGFLVKSAKQRDGLWGLDIVASELLEYSHTPVPQNPEALVDRVGKGVLAGRPIEPSLLKSFTPWLPPPREIVTSGWEAKVEAEIEAEAQEFVEGILEKAREAKRARVAAKAGPADDVSKHLEAMPGYKDKSDAEKSALQDCVSRKIPKLIDEGYDRAQAAAVAYHMCGEKKGEEKKSMSTATPAPEPAPLIDPALPPSAAASVALHDRLAEFGEFLDGLARRQEHAAFKGLLDSLAGEVEARMEHVEGFTKSEYPDLPELSADPPEGFEADPRHGPRLASLSRRLAAVREQEKARQARKRMTAGARGVCKKAAEYLDDVSKYEGAFTSTHRSAAMYHAKALNDVAGSDANGDGLQDYGDAAKALRAENEALRARLVALHKDFHDLQKETRRAFRGR